MCNRGSSLCQQQSQQRSRLSHVMNYNHLRQLIDIQQVYFQFVHFYTCNLVFVSRENL